jgi:hypothetical protein
MREHSFHHFSERNMQSSKNIFSLETLFREARKEVDEQSEKQEPLLSQDDITALLDGYKPQTSEVLPILRTAKE